MTEPGPEVSAVGLAAFVIWMPETGVSAQGPFVMVLFSSVTAPFRASSCPCTVAPVCAAMDVSAKMCPTNSELVPSVAEDGTTQNTRQNRAPLVSTTLLPAPVISVEVLLKMKTASGSPPASSVSVPVMPRAPPDS